MTNHLTFHSTGNSEAPTPIPTGKNLPDWFKALKQSIEDMPIPIDKTAKLCMPLNDALRLGWFLRAPETIHLEKQQGQLELGDANAATVSILDTAQRETGENSAYYLPECLVATEWGIETPPGYATFLTQPFNRDELRFTVPGMLANTDDHTDEIHIPLYVEQDQIRIEQGEPIAQVIPVSREDLAIESSAESFGDNPTAEQIHRKVMRASERRKGVYRKEAWVPKPSARIVQDPHNIKPNNDQQNPAADGSGRAIEHGESSLLDDDRLTYYCFEDRLEDLPPPVDAAAYLPDGHQDRIEEIDGINASQPTSTWLIDAMTTGTIIPLPAQATVRRTDGKLPLEVTSEGETEHNVQHPLKAGEDHPLAPVTIVNFSSAWVVNPPWGYSVLVCSPFGHYQRYYRSYAGLADFDRYMTYANAPGLFTDRTDEWTFPAKTPVSQHIPINRENILSIATIEE